MFKGQRSNYERKHPTKQRATLITKGTKTTAPVVGSSAPLWLTLLLTLLGFTGPSEHFAQSSPHHGLIFSGEWEGKASFSPLPVRETCREAAWAYFRQELFSELCSLLGVWEVAAGLGTTFKCPLADRREKRWLESYRAHSVCSLCTGQQEYLRGQSNSTSPSLNPRT